MSITTLRERAGGALLHAGTELAFDQEALERAVATVPGRDQYASALGAVALARWVDRVLLWLGFRVHPGTIPRVL